VKEASGEVSMHIIEKRALQNIGIGTEIVSISVSVAELLLLPVWDTVSTSGLHQRYSPKSGNVDTRGNRSDVL